VPVRCNGTFSHTTSENSENYYYTMNANLQKMVLTDARVRRPHWREVLSRGASIPSSVEPARRRFVKAFSYADCFFRRPLASNTCAEFHHFGTHSPRSVASENRPKTHGFNRTVQPNPAAGRPTSGSNLTPASLRLRQARRAAAGFNTEGYRLMGESVDLNLFEDKQ